nr:hypothetical protein [Desulfobulbaceae bacterium]
MQLFFQFADLQLEVGLPLLLQGNTLLQPLTEPFGGFFQVRKILTGDLPFDQIIALFPKLFSGRELLKNVFTLFKFDPRGLAPLFRNQQVGLCPGQIEVA